jgi:hypothetical protein
MPKASSQEERFTKLYPHINNFESAYLKALYKKYKNITLENLFKEKIYTEKEKYLAIEILELRLFSENLYYVTLLNVETQEDFFNIFSELRKTHLYLRPFNLDSYEDFTFRFLYSFKNLLLVKNEIAKGVLLYDFLIASEVKNGEYIPRYFDAIGKRIVVNKRIIDVKRLNDLKSIGTRKISFINQKPYKFSVDYTDVQ